MQSTTETTVKNGVQRGNSFFVAMVGIAGICAIATTFFLANGTLSLAAKTAGFSGTVFSFLIICFLTYLRQLRTDQDLTAFISDEIDRTREQGLRALDEAAGVFGGSFKRADVLRLIFGRLQHLLAIDRAELLLLNATRTRLVVTDAEGPGRDTVGQNVVFGKGTAGSCYSSGEIRIDRAGSAEGIRVAAIPLRHGTDVFGVLQLYFPTGSSQLEDDASLFEFIGERVSPMILSSIAFERNLSNALTDATTDLPNERAFHLILENQVAESQRKREERPLTILAIDIKNFDEINNTFGYAAGDRVLYFAANIIRDSLRQMDFFARSRDDEFLVVLPTATEQMSQDIVKRIQTGFLKRKVALSESDNVEISLNFGWSAFGVDGETPDQLLRIARVRKTESKSTRPKVVWFPHEAVH